MDLKNFEKYQKSFGTVLKTWQKNVCGRATFLETLKTAIILQSFPCWFSKKSFADIFRNVDFLFDTIDLKQSVKVSWENLLKTVLHKVCPFLGRTTSKSPPYSRHISNSLNMYLFLEFESNQKNSIIKGWKNIKSRQALKTQGKCAEVPQYSISMHPFSVAPSFFENISPR